MGKSLHIEAETGLTRAIQWSQIHSINRRCLVDTCNDFILSSQIVKYYLHSLILGLAMAWLHEEVPIRKTKVAMCWSCIPGGCWANVCSPGHIFITSYPHAIANTASFKVTNHLICSIKMQFDISSYLLEKRDDKRARRSQRGACTVSNERKHIRPLHHQGRLILLYWSKYKQQYMSVD